MAGKNKPKKASPGPFEALRALKEDLKKREEARAPNKPGAPSMPATRPAARAPVPAGASGSSGSSGSGPRASDQDDTMTMHRLFAGVEPLDRTRGRLPKQRIDRSPAVERLPAQMADAAKAEAEAVHEHLRTLVEGGSRFEVEDDGRRVEGRRVDLPLDALRRLRRGSLPIDARVDLHGMTAHEARDKIEVFLRTTRSRGERCVLVIHGKGEHSPGGAGVLRGEIAAWLSQGAASEHVAAFATAAGGDGGEGAVYVLLRR
jgi:DNA-nicking Smr family endonuclease